MRGSDQFEVSEIMVSAQRLKSRLTGMTEEEAENKPKEIKINDIIIIFALRNHVSLRKS